MSGCCQRPALEFQYGTWHRCRECGAWLEILVAPGGIQGRPDAAQLPIVRSAVVPARPHAWGSQGGDA